ncbi:hypothetical protein V6N11_022443 [Hibiscus sabdariffa]|uniref:RNase H type-1 domain-containing protein n=1 Tax=Hibiscus sabdariffa TaxID=183260 RepID=A0ABR2TJR6_9ROSI
MAACIVPYNNVSDAFVAEALTCKNAIQVAKDMRLLNVIVERDRDSLSVVKKLNSTTHDSSVIALIIVDIKDLAKSFNIISFYFVHRGANKGSRVLSCSRSTLLNRNYAIGTAAVAEANRRNLLSN